MSIAATDSQKKYIIFNFVAMVLCIMLLMRFAFVTEPVNAIILSVVLFLVFTVLTIFLRSNKYVEFSKFLFVFCLGIILRLSASQLHSGSDVFWVSKESINAILNGVNPYSTTFFVQNNPAIAGVPITVQAYFPFTMLYEIPFQQILGDLRYGIIFADVGIAVLLYSIVRIKNEDLARAASCFYMLITSLSFLFPNVIFDYRVSDGLTDPIMTLFLLLSFYLYLKDQRIASAILLGVAIATRQFSILFFIPMIMLWLRKNEFGKRDLKLIGISIVTASVILLPFFLWSPSDFIGDTILATSNHALTPSLGGPQWNTAIFPQMKFLGFDITLTIAKLIQMVSIISIIVFFRVKITRVELSLRLFFILYVIFLATSNFTQYFYWFNVLPFLIIAFVQYHYEQKDALSTSGKSNIN